MEEGIQATTTMRADVELKTGIMIPKTHYKLLKQNEHNHLSFQNL